MSGDRRKYSIYMVNLLINLIIINTYVLFCTYLGLTPNWLKNFPEAETQTG